MLRIAPSDTPTLRPDDRVAPSVCGACGWKGIPLRERETLEGPVIATRCPVCKEPVVYGERHAG